MIPETWIDDKLLSARSQTSAAAFIWINMSIGGIGGGRGGMVSSWTSGENSGSGEIVERPWSGGVVVEFSKWPKNEANHQPCSVW